MKNITLSADENLTAKARLLAHTPRKTLNETLREYLALYAA